MKLLRYSVVIILLLMTGEACAGVAMFSFTAKPQGQTVVIEWKTWMEFDNTGFNLYRSEKKDGDYIKINDSFIPTKSTGPYSGGSYTLTDTAVADRTKYYYRLETVDAKGASQFIDAVPALVAKQFLGSGTDCCHKPFIRHLGKLTGKHYCGRRRRHHPAL